MSRRRRVTAITLTTLVARATLVFLLCLGLLAAWAPSAFAHAAFLDSTPHAGGRLDSSPSQIVLQFTEPLNRPLSNATLANAATGNRIAATKLQGKDDQLALRPNGRLPRAPYRVEWHTVSTVDGHALEGSFGFGVRTAAAETAHQIEQSPLARGGWLRIGFRALFYAALFFFAGGLLNAMLLGGRGPADWLVPKNLGPPLAKAGMDPQTLANRVWNWTLDAGWLAAGAGVATALIEAADAGGSLNLENASDFLLTNSAGLARVGTVLAIVLALLCAPRLRLAAAAMIALAFLTIASSGHANSAEPRLLAVVTDWAHLLAAAVWIGGIAQIALAWLPVIHRTGRTLRSEVMRAVLERFGKVALPAFLVVASTGLTNALIELGEVRALWDSSYGRVLAVKIALVGLIAVASYVHALRLRPRLLEANPHPHERVERRHWRLLSVEPLLAVAVVGVAAVLVAFPLPPRQLGELAEAEPVAACDPCPLPAPKRDELVVADQAGSRIAAFWLRRGGERLSGTLRLLDSQAKPVDASLRLAGAEPNSCGVGCWRFGVAETASRVAVLVEEEGKRYRASVPAIWEESANSRARKLLARAQGTMRGLQSLKEEERLTSGPGTYVRTLYRLNAPHRFAYQTSVGGRSIVIGKRQWTRTLGDAWQVRQFGPARAFRTKDFFRWTPYARAARLLRVYGTAGGRIADVALMDPATPVWFRLHIELSTGRVLKDRMITKAHFMDRRYLAFNEPVEIEPPSRSVPTP
jgi:copper transport protein